MNNSENFPFLNSSSVLLFYGDLSVCNDSKINKLSTIYEFGMDKRAGRTK